MPMTALMPAAKRRSIVKQTHDLVFRRVHGSNLIYNCAWEDPRIDRHLLQLNETSRVVMITSAGCNVLDYALLGPARLPGAIVRRLNNETLRAMNIPDVRARLDQQGFEIEGSTPEACRDYIRGELAKWAKLVAAAGIKAESLR